ncbi:hypothetical protein [Micromonospora sp. NPDC005205]|uniref:hypothetical protein n=1 Tax=Micromonospora sp. NPDC005205 TaxID=3156714 RepID=UPI00339E720A
MDAIRDGERVRPDAHGVWTNGRNNVGSWPEYDRATEDHPCLRDKLDPCWRLRMDGGPGHILLFSLPSRERERNFHAKLVDAARHDHRVADSLAALTVATCARDRINGNSPDVPVWRLVGNADDEPGPLNPAHHV